MFKIKCKVVIDSALSVVGDQSRREFFFYIYFMNINSGHYLLFLDILIYLYLIHKYQFWTLSAILEHSKLKFKVVIVSPLVCSRGPKQSGVFLSIFIS